MKLLGIISDHRAHVSKSPAMHNRVLARSGINGAYLPLAVAPDRLGQAVDGLRGLNFCGANVTVPYKEKIMDHLDGLGPETRAIGAVNTIINQEGSLIGRNTDALGFASALDEYGLKSRGRALVVGTGGAAKAVVKALNNLGFREIILCGRSKPDPDQLDQKIQWVPLAGLTGKLLVTDLVVNATSVSAPREAPDLAALIHKFRLSGCGLVFDLNYGRAENIWQWLAERSKAGFRDGLTMLSFQAAESFRLWTGMNVTADQFLAALEEEQ